MAYIIYVCIYLNNLSGLDFKMLYWYIYGQADLRWRQISSFKFDSK